MIYSTDDIKSIVDEINEVYGTDTFLPCKYTWQDGVDYVKCFGKFIWDSENYTTESKSVVRDMCYYNLNKILNPVWKQQLEALKGDIMHHVNDLGSEDLKQVLEEYFMEEECLLNKI